MADKNTESEEAKKEYLNDQWTTEVHLLGRERYVESIHNLILTVNPPFSLSINGRWGSGKTSILRALLDKLGGTHVEYVHGITGHRVNDENEVPKNENNSENQDKTDLKENIAVWFNPWQYQQEEDPLIPLLHEIRAQIHAYTKLKGLFKGNLRRHTEVAMHTITGVVDAALTIFSPLKKTKIASETVQNIRSEGFHNLTDAQRFFLHFEEAIKQAVGEQGRLVIFVDDLDRCSDEAVFKLLEAIKLYLSSEHCVFVFGLDSGHVESAISKVTEYNYQEATQYVDKLFQARLDLPEPSETEMQAFIKHHVEAIFPEDSESPQFDIDTLNLYLPTNPRFVKNFLNSLKLYSQLWVTLHDEKMDEHKFLLLQLFRAFYLDAYELLKQDPEQLVIVNKVLKGEISSEEVDNYIHYIVENPIYSTPKFIQERIEKDKGINDERFRQIRTKIPLSKVNKVFHEDFCNTFGTDETSLKLYLL